MPYGLTKSFLYHFSQIRPTTWVMADLGQFLVWKLYWRLPDWLRFGERTYSAGDFGQEGSYSGMNRLIRTLLYRESTLSSIHLLRNRSVRLNRFIICEFCGVWPLTSAPKVKSPKSFISISLFFKNAGNYLPKRIVTTDLGERSNELLYTCPEPGEPVPKIISSDILATFLARWEAVNSYTYEYDKLALFSVQ